MQIQLTYSALFWQRRGWKRKGCTKEKSSRDRVRGENGKMKRMWNKEASWATEVKRG